MPSDRLDLRPLPFLAAADRKTHWLRRRAGVNIASTKGRPLSFPNALRPKSDGQLSLSAAAETAMSRTGRAPPVPLIPIAKKEIGVTRFTLPVAECASYSSWVSVLGKETGDEAEPLAA